MIVFRFEQIYPIALGIIAFAFYVRFGQQLYAWSQKDGFHLENSYAPAAAVFAVIAGFLASFYGSIQSLADTRLKRIARSPLFRRFVGQIKEATIAGFVLTVLSLPYIIVSPAGDGSPGSRIFIGIWLGASIYALATFARVGRLLFFVFEHQPPDDRGAH